MKILSILLIYIISLSIAQEQKNGIYQLTTANMKDFIQAHNHVLIKFYAPWCQHSQKLAPQFEKAAKTLSAHNIVLAEVDCSIETDLAEILMINDYPTLLYFRKQKLIEYNGGKTSDEIEAWCKKKLLPPVTEIRSMGELSEYQKDKNNIIIVYFGETNIDQYQQFEETVHLFNNDNLKFLSTPNLMNNFNIESIPYIIILKQFEENRIDFNGVMDSVELKKFILQNMFPRVVQLSESTAEFIFNDNYPVMLIYLNSVNNLTEIEKQNLGEFHQGAKSINRELIMAECYIDNEVCSRIAQFTGIEYNNNQPLIQILDPRGPVIKKYLLQSELINQESIKQFANQFENNLLKPYYKSQDIPINDPGKKIKIIVGKNFIQQVIKQNSNVVVNFYAEWCSKSQQFKPIYEKVAEILGEKQDLIFAQIEASENEVPEIDINFFPTVMIFTKENKDKPIQFEGEKQDVDQLVQFIETNIKIQDEREKTDL